MKTKEKLNKGITLIALIITIVILLILAGVAIASLTNNGLLERAKDAKEKSKMSNAKEKIVLALNEWKVSNLTEGTSLEDFLNTNVPNDEIDSFEVREYNTYKLLKNGYFLVADSNGTIVEDIKSVENKDKIVTGKIVDAVNNGDINIGDYVKYVPDTASTDDILKELNMYSGSTDNTKSTLTQENLNWKVFDVKDNQVRLISELPTESQIYLYGYSAYNNVVKLLDDTCEALYNSDLASKVQNLKIEDVQNKMVETDLTDGNPQYGSKFTAVFKNYPSIFAKEQYQKVNGKLGTELNLNEQTDLINEKTSIAASSLEAQWTAWSKTINQTDYKKSVYYDIFVINDSAYSLSSRCISFGSYAINFNFFCISSNQVKFRQICNSYNVQLSPNNSVRPVITLNSNVEIDTENSGNGDSAIHAYAIK